MAKWKKKQLTEAEERQLAKFETNLGCVKLLFFGFGFCLSCYTAKVLFEMKLYKTGIVAWFAGMFFTTLVMGSDGKISKTEAVSTYLLYRELSREKKPEAEDKKSNEWGPDPW